MKRFFCVLICIVLFISYNVIPAYALGGPIMDDEYIVELKDFGYIGFKSR